MALEQFAILCSHVSEATATLTPQLTPGRGSSVRPSDAGPQACCVFERSVMASQRTPALLI